MISCLRLCTDAILLRSAFIPPFDQVLLSVLFWLGVIAMIVTLFKVAPYGKYSYSNRHILEYKLDWFDRLNFTVDGKWGWFVQELPSSLFYLYTFLHAMMGKEGFEPHLSHWIHLLLFQMHYIHRAFIYTWIRCKSMSDSSIAVVVCGILFCATNGYLNARFSILYAEKIDSNLMLTLIGIVMFFYGFYVNYTSDGILFALRESTNSNNDPNEKYKIPYGGYFDYVTCGNYFGEIIEWIGYALLTRHCAAIVFALWTPFNLVPRAISQHDWYKRKFGERYPSNRKIIIPYIF
jgi:3-oxo-5-alpha-steroid 4-dehydrogenase 1